MKNGDEKRTKKKKKPHNKKTAKGMKFADVKLLYSFSCGRHVDLML